MQHFGVRDIIGTVEDQGTVSPADLEIFAVDDDGFENKAHLEATPDNTQFSVDGPASLAEERYLNKLHSMDATAPLRVEEDKDYEQSGLRVSTAPTSAAAHSAKVQPEQAGERPDHQSSKSVDTLLLALLVLAAAMAMAGVAFIFVRRRRAQRRENQVVQQAFWSAGPWRPGEVGNDKQAIILTDSTDLRVL